MYTSSVMMIMAYHQMSILSIWLSTIGVNMQIIPYIKTLTFSHPTMMPCNKIILGNMLILTTITLALQGILVLMLMFLINGMFGKHLCIINIMDNELLLFMLLCLISLFNILLLLLYIFSTFIFIDKTTNFI